MKQNGVVCSPGPALLFFIFRFEYLISGPLSYRDFRETGPWAVHTCSNFWEHQIVNMSLPITLAAFQGIYNNGWGTFAKLFVEQFTVNEGMSYECPLLATSVKCR